MLLSKHSMNFLIENRLQNSREWYLEHKAEYTKYVYEPLAQLVEDLTPTVLEIDPNFVTLPKVDKTISRVYRDTRFSKDKSLYRDTMWIAFSRSKKDLPEAPGLFFEISPRFFRWGCGYYTVPPKVMDEMRRLILTKDSSFLAMQDFYQSHSSYRREGEQYKRTRYPEAPEELQPWLNYKSFYFMQSSTDFSALFSPEFAKTLASSFAELSPAYHFYLKARQLAKL